MSCAQFCLGRRRWRVLSGVLREGNLLCSGLQRLPAPPGTELERARPIYEFNPLRRCEAAPRGAPAAPAPREVGAGFAPYSSPTGKGCTPPRPQGQNAEAPPARAGRDRLTPAAPPPGRVSQVGRQCPAPAPPAAAGTNQPRTQTEYQVQSAR